MKQFQLVFIFISSTLLLFQTSFGQKHIVDLQLTLGGGYPEVDYSRNVTLENTDVVLTNNVQLGISNRIYKSIYLKAQIGTADHDLFVKTSFGAFEALTHYQSINQHFIGLCPEVIFGGDEMKVSFGVGPTMYFVRTMVENNYIKQVPEDGMGPFFDHPELERIRFGYNAYINLYVPVDHFGFIIGIDSKYNKLFKEHRYLPSISLGIFNLKFGISYFFFDKEAENDIESNDGIK